MTLDPKDRLAAPVAKGTTLVLAALLAISLAGCGRTASSSSAESTPASADDQASTAASQETTSDSSTEVPAMSVQQVIDATTAAVVAFNKSESASPIPEIFAQYIYKYVNSGFHYTELEKSAWGDVYAAVGRLAQAELSAGDVFPEYWYGMVSVPEDRQPYVEEVLRPIEEANRSGDFDSIVADLDSYAGKGDDHFRNVKITMAYHILRSRSDTKGTDAHKRVKEYYDDLYAKYFEGSLLN